MKRKQVPSGRGGLPLRPIVLVALFLLLAALPTAFAEVRTFTISGTLQPQPLDGASGYYPPRLVLEAGDTVVFRKLTPTDTEHPAALFRGASVETGEFYFADCLDGGNSPDCSFYGEPTTYTGLPEGHYAFVCIYHSVMVGELDVVADLT